MVVWPTPLVLAWPRAALCLAFLWHRDDRRPNTHVPLHTTTAKLWSSVTFFFFSLSSFSFSLSLFLSLLLKNQRTHPVTLKTIAKRKTSNFPKGVGKVGPVRQPGDEYCKIDNFENAHLHISSQLRGWFRQRWTWKKKSGSPEGEIMYSHCHGLRVVWLLPPAVILGIAKRFTGHAVAKLRPKRHLLPIMQAHYHASEPSFTSRDCRSGEALPSRFKSGRAALFQNDESNHFS